MSENSASCDIELIEDTISHISEDEDIISPESVAPDDNSSSVHPQKKLRQSSATQGMEWLERGTKGSLCKYCKEHGRVNQSNRGTWIKIPYNKSKKLAEAARKHELTSAHLAAKEIYYLSRELTGTHSSVINQLQQAARANETEDREVFRLLFQGAYWLFKSEVAHTTHWSSLLDLLANCDMSGRIRDFFESRPLNAKYTSQSTICDMLNVISEVLDEETVSMLNQSIGKYGFFGIMADEATNTKTECILSICVRFLGSNGDIIERFLSITGEISKATASALLSKVEEVFQTRNVDMNKIICCSFDGASNMSGHYGGLQAIIREKYNRDLVYVHCHAHRLQLVAQSASGNFKVVYSTLSILGCLYNFFSRSTKRTSALSNVQLALEVCPVKLVQPSATRWLAHERCVKRVLQIYPSLLLCLEEIRDEWGQEAAEAAGLLSALRSRNTLKALMVLDVVFGILGTMSRVFQGKQCDAVAAMGLIRNCIPMLSNINIHSVIDDGISELTGRCT